MIEFFQTKIQNIKNKLESKGLNDPNVLGIFLLAIIGLTVIWNGTRVVQQNYSLLQKIAVLEEENRILELENANKKIQNEYYKTTEFAELKLRRVNGKALPGERVFIIDDQTALNSLKTPEQEELNLDQQTKPKYQQNFEAWVDFFLGSS